MREDNFLIPIFVSANKAPKKKTKKTRSLSSLENSDAYTWLTLKMKIVIVDFFQNNFLFALHSLWKLTLPLDSIGS